MDDVSKIETYKAGLRLLYASNIAGLITMITALMNGSAAEEVIITGQTFESGSAQGVLSFDPVAKLNAALAVLAELDPTSAATIQSPGKIRYADFSRMCTET